MADTPQIDDDIDKDGIPDAVEKSVWASRRKMAWVSLWGMILPTIYIVLRITDVHLMDSIGDLMSWYYLSLASIVGAFFGFTAWANIKGRGKVE